MRKRRFVSFVMTFAMILSLAVFVNAEGSLPFKDVPEGKWYYENVKYVYDNSLMEGTSDDTFAPTSNLTRAMFVTVLGIEIVPSARVGQT